MDNQEAPSGFAVRHSIERVSEPMQIRDYDWRLVLYWGRRGESEATTLLAGLELRRRNADWTTVDWPGWHGWHGIRIHPTASFNGEIEGLPRALRTLWERCPWAHTEAIERRMAQV